MEYANDLSQKGARILVSSIVKIKNSKTQWAMLSVLSAVTWLVAIQLAGTSAAETTPDVDNEGRFDINFSQSFTVVSGEGEGEENAEELTSVVEVRGEVSSGDADLSTNDIAYLTQLGLIRGHLLVGHTLYQQDLPDLAETHMKHPQEEIYSSIEPAFANRGCAGFADELSQLAESVGNRTPSKSVAETYGSLSEAISACEGVVESIEPIAITKVIENLLRTAAVEYQIGVVDGKMNNLHEYQDAWGFTQIAAEWARNPVFVNSADAIVVSERLQDLIASLDPLWPSLDAESVAEGDAEQLFDAAGQVEITAVPLSR